MFDDKTSDVSAAAGLQSSNRPSILNSVQDGESSIALGCSAMSGCSSASQRRIATRAKMRDMAQKHGMVDEEVSIKHVYAEFKQSSQRSDREWQVSDSKRTSEITQPYQHSQAIHGEHDMEGNREVDSKYERTTENVSVSNDESEKEKQDEENEETQQTFNKEVVMPRNKEVADTENYIDPQVIQEFKERLDNQDHSVFYDMFELLIVKLSSVQNEVVLVQKDQASLNTKVSNIQHNLQMCVNSIDEMDEELGEVTDTNLKLVQTAVKVEAEVEDVKTSIEVMRNKSHKGSFIINGLDYSAEKSAC